MKPSFPPDSYALWDRIEEIGGKFTAGQVDETEAYDQLREAGRTPGGAEGHIARWRDDEPQ